ncbi:DUF1311 domain-containing protein [Altererythrobacter xixiisoli]|uniref:DUF1311 domain-containing protein n=1 Tax=Croceibacterium xixiisoli TaxID=1476466 RepID=A0A6I4TXS0_9SPHN|nr:lysozyme inhibitor LprI family protein [Croceibacterium xixiisoli]MXP00733.1 DUF1311 domain-containing protein [Croceibacterium xixiisoli]
MHTFSRSFILISLLGLATAAPAQAQEGGTRQAGFDCSKAASLTEKAICNDDDTAEADRAMSIAFRALVDRSTPDMQAALRQDQQAFLKQRAEAFESPRSNPQMRQEGLRDRTEMRAEFFNWIATTPATSFIGTWRNAWGIIEVKQAAHGRLAVDFEVADQANGSWLCRFSGELEHNFTDEAIMASDAGPLQMNLDGAMLRIPTPFCDETTSGGFGTAAGTYFRIGT